MVEEAPKKKIMFAESVKKEEVDDIDLLIYGQDILSLLLPSLLLPDSFPPFISLSLPTTPFYSNIISRCYHYRYLICK